MAGPALTQTVNQLNVLQAAAYLGVNRLVEETIAGSNTVDRALLSHLTVGSAGATLFYQGVLRYLKTGQSKSDNPAVKEFVRLDGTVEQESGADEEESEERTLLHQYCRETCGSFEFCDNHSIESLAQQMDTAVSNHVMGKAGLLAAKVLEFDETKNGNIELIETNPEYSDMEKFWSINQLLPAKDRWSIIPSASIVNSFVTLTEDVG